MDALSAHIKTTKEILSTQGLADLLGKKLQTIYNWNAKGMSMPPRLMIPGTKGDRYLLSDVLAWASAFKEPPAKLGRPRKVTLA